MDSSSGTLSHVLGSVRRLVGALETLWRSKDTLDLQLSRAVRLDSEVVGLSCVLSISAFVIDPDSTRCALFFMHVHSVKTLILIPVLTALFVTLA